MKTTNNKEETFLNSPKAAVFISLIIVFCLFCVILAKSMEEPVVYRWEPYVVMNGDTLWAIARDEAVVFNGEDLSSMCHIIADKNGIKGSAIYAGQTILVPVGKE